MTQNLSLIVGAYHQIRKAELAEQLNESPTFVSAFRSRKGRTPEAEKIASVDASVAALDASATFKVSQFLRTLVYESLPPGVDTLAVLLAETLVFRHTLGQACRAVLARSLLPVPMVGPLAAMVKANTLGFNLFAIFFYPFQHGFWVCLSLVVFSDDVRNYVTPLELLPLAALYYTRAVVLACKYAYLPVSYVGDAETLGIMYTPEYSFQTMASTLVLITWNDPYSKTNSSLASDVNGDVLRTEMEAACVLADVNLDGLEVHVGSHRAAEVVRTMAQGIVERSAASPSASPDAVSAKELLASIMVRFYGKPMPGFSMALINVMAVVFACAFPTCRAISGAPAFGATNLGTMACTFHLMYALQGFRVNFGFAISAAWDFRRRRHALESLAAMLSGHGDAITELDEHAGATDVEAGQRAVGDRTRDGNEGAPRICIEVKNPTSALAWSLVRRATRKVGAVWMHRMNAYNTAFLCLAVACTGALQGLYYGVDAYPHRLVAAMGLAVVAFNISLLCSLAVFEAAQINEAVPEHIMLLKRQMVALSAELADSSFHAEGNAEKHRRMESTLELLKNIGAAVSHEEEVHDPFVVFGRVPAGPGAMTATVGILVSMLVVAVQRLTYLYDIGWSYSGHWGEFVPSE